MEAGIERKLNFPASAVWSLISNFGDRHWSNTIDKVVVEGEGIGAVRKMYIGDAPPCVERLEFLDPENMTLSISIVENNPIALDDFLGTCRVIALDEHSCKVDWKGTGTLSGGTVEEVHTMMKAIYNGTVDSIEAYLSKASTA